MNEEIDNLANNEAYLFAERIEANPKSASNEWPEFLERIQFEQNLRDKLANCLFPFNNKAKDIINYFMEDLYFTLNQDIRINDIKMPLQLNIRDIAKIAGGAVGLFGVLFLFIEGLKSISPYLAGVALVLSIGSELFDTKAKKRQKRIEKIHNAIKVEIDKEKLSIINNICNTLDNEMSSVISQIDNMYKNAIDDISFSVEQSISIRNCYVEQEDWINKFYAWRIVQFLSKEKTRFSKYEVYHEIIYVQRPEEHVLYIQCNHTGLDPSVLKDVIVDRVNII